MEKKIELIRGTFSVPQAREVLLRLIEYKINFHERENFSNEIKKGSRDATSVLRINELSASRKELLEYLAAQPAEKLLKLKAEIEIDNV